jgi:hypothetical protein
MMLGNEEKDCRWRYERRSTWGGRPWLFFHALLSILDPSAPKIVGTMLDCELSQKQLPCPGRADGPAVLAPADRQLYRFIRMDQHDLEVKTGLLVLIHRRLQCMLRVRKSSLGLTSAKPCVRDRVTS